ncbi:hypothetical protein AB9K17_23820, partial [Salmonella enterica subsp. enterica serovar Kentucky]|uniref:hypothetical protein n=1 Tax=Salmonella enterica TaxID=28901 RepID=UPI003F4B9E00
ERFVQTFKRAMKASQHDGKSLQHRLSNFLLTYRSAPHATTNQSPSSLFLKREVFTFKPATLSLQINLLLTLLSLSG